MTSQLNDAENLSRIREILFGNEIEGMEKRVQVVKEEISQIVQRFEEEAKLKYAENQRFVDDKVLTLKHLVDEKSAEHVKKVEGVEKEINDIRLHFEDSFSKLSTQIENTTEHFKQITEQNLKLIREVNNKYNALQAEVKSIDKAKLEKEKLAELLNQLAKELLTVDQDDK